MPVNTSEINQPGKEMGEDYGVLDFALQANLLNGLAVDGEADEETQSE